MSDSYPQLAARTLRFSLGIPRNIAIRDATVFFVRTEHGTDRVGKLWSYSVERDTEVCIVDPATLLGAAAEELSPEERARRERSREAASGIVDYSLDDEGTWAAFSVSGRLFATHISSRITKELPTPGPVVDPRVDPKGRHIAYVCGGDLRVMTVRGEDDRALATADSATDAWGLAEFIAAEEMNRHRGFWWAPDSASLLVEHYDEAPVHVWHIADPAQPQKPAVEHRYPAAGTPNARVRLWHIDLAGQRTQINWDHEDYEYLGRVSWTKHGPPVLQVLSRDQRSSQLLTVEPKTGATRIIRDFFDPAWVELVGTAHYGHNGRLITIEDRDGARKLVVDHRPVTPLDWYVRSVIHNDEHGVTVTYSTDATEVHVATVSWSDEISMLTEGTAVHGAVAGRQTLVLTSMNLESPEPVFEVRHRALRGRLNVAMETPPITANPIFLSSGPHDIKTAVLFPTGSNPGARHLPILMHPYGGPHAQRVMASARAFLEPQWLADQGFCVVVADGRGTPGRDPQFERKVHYDLAEVTLQDQVDALLAVVDRFGDDVDPSRVGISGWSYGGYLAALAVLRRPDLFHAAVAGAPVTEWRLYDTCYTERYLGDPNTQAEVYDRNSLLPLADQLTRPLLIIHGLADDNVVAAHSLQLSSALLAAGRRHQVLPLSGVTHMTPQEKVAENLLRFQVQFLHEALSSETGLVQSDGLPADPL